MSTHTELLQSFSKRRYILLDFDGTLADTTQLLASQAYAALRAFGWTDEQIGDPIRLVGPPWPAGFRIVYGMSEEEAQHVARLSQSLRTDTSDTTFDLFEGALEFLQDVSQDPCRIPILVTSRNTSHVLSVVHKKGIAQLFDGIFGQDDPTQAGKAALVGAALEHYGAFPEDCIAIGDRFYDVEMAHAWNIPCIGCLWGVGGHKELSEAGCDVEVANFGELRELLGMTSKA